MAATVRCIVASQVAARPFAALQVGQENASSAAMRYLGCLFGLAVSVVACSEEEMARASSDSTVDAGTSDSDASPNSDGTAAGAMQMALRFEARVGTEAFSCSGHFHGVGTGDSHVTPLDFRVYVHDVRLITADGREQAVTLEQDGVWQQGNLALLDFEDKTGSCANGTSETHTTLTGQVASGSYNGIRFKIGVPFAMNHGNVATAASPLNLSGLFWSWNDGYKFAKLDAKLSEHGSQTTKSFLLHLGSIGCKQDGAGAVTSCAYPNVGEVELSGFDPLKQNIIADYAAVYAGTDLQQEKGGAPGCMSGVDDPECPNLLRRFGIDPLTGKPNASTQALFSYE